MPRFDGTGPMGKGEMTGHGRGYCIVPLEDVKYPSPKQQFDSDTSQKDRRTNLYMRRRGLGRRWAHRK